MERYLWKELSYSKEFSRKDEVNIENYDYDSLEEPMVVSYGLYEDLTIKNCFCVENIWSVIDEYN